MVENIGDVLRLVWRARLITPRLVLILTALPYSGTLPRFAPVPALL